MTRITYLGAALVALASAASLSAQNLNNGANACLEVYGINCLTTPGWSGVENEVRAFLKANPTATQAQIVQNLLLPGVQNDPGRQMAIIDTVYARFGQKATSENEYVWQRQYGQKWRTYNDLVPLVKVNATPALPSASIVSTPRVDPNQTQAVQQAFQKVFLRPPSPAELQRAANSSAVNTATAEGWVRAGLPRSSADISRIIDVVFPLAVNAPPSPQQKSMLTSYLGRTWTGADDLAAYLRQNPALFPRAVPFSNGQVFVALNGTLLSPQVLGSGGYLLDINGNNIVAQGGGNYVDTKTGILMNASGPITVQTYRTSGTGYLVNTNGSNIVAQGGGNIVAQGGGNIVAQGGLNIVAQGGLNLVPSFGRYGVYDPAAVARALANPSKVISNDGGTLARSVGTQAGAAPIILNGGGNFISDHGAAFHTQSVGSTAPAATIQLSAAQTWSRGTPLTLYWTLRATAAVPAANCVRIRFNGSVPLTTSVDLKASHFTIPAFMAASFTPGRQVNLDLFDSCTNKVLSSPVSTLVR